MCDCVCCSVPSRFPCPRSGSGFPVSFGDTKHRADGLQRRLLFKLSPEGKTDDMLISLNDTTGKARFSSPVILALLSALISWLSPR